MKKGLRIAGIIISISLVLLIALYLNSKKQFSDYITTRYPGVAYEVSDIKYNIKNKTYTATAKFKDEKIRFDLTRYSSGEITDNYLETKLKKEYLERVNKIVEDNNLSEYINNVNVDYVDVRGNRCNISFNYNDNVDNEEKLAEISQNIINVLNKEETVKVDTFLFTKHKKSTTYNLTIYSEESNISYNDILNKIEIQVEQPDSKR